MKREKEEREETVARRRERSRMKRAHKETQWLNSAEQAAELRLRKRGLHILGELVP